MIRVKRSVLFTLPDYVSLIELYTAGRCTSATPRYLRPVCFYPRRDWGN